MSRILSCALMTMLAATAVIPNANPALAAAAVAQITIPVPDARGSIAFPRIVPGRGASARIA